MFKSCNIRKATYILINYDNNRFRFCKNKFQLEKGWEIEKNNDFLNAFENLKNIGSFGNNSNAYNEGNSDNKVNSEEVERCSRLRVKREVRELALSNDFDLFGTLTINSSSCDRFSLDMCQDKLKKILKKIKRNNKDFRYLIITEKHKNGAFHFHGLFNGINEKYLIVNKYNYLECELFNDLGYNSFSYVRDKTRVSNYITKYITKDCVKNSCNQSYIRSKGLNFASYERLDFIEDCTIEWTFENEFCCFYDFELTNLNNNDRMLLVDLVKYV